MTSTPDEHDAREELDELRQEIDELKATPVEDLVDPQPGDLRDVEPRPVPTDAIGSEDWDDPKK